MTTATFNYIDTSSYTTKPWNKVDGPGTSFTQLPRTRHVSNLRGHFSDYTTENAGFAVLVSPASEKSFTDDNAIRRGYYAEVETLLRENLKSVGNVKKVVIFDHTIRRSVKDSPRQPVLQVHVDQTPAAAEARVRRHLDAEEAEVLLQGRYQIINVWRPISHSASDFPLGVIDWRSTQPEDFIAVDLLYPRRDNHSPEVDDEDDDDRGKEKLPDKESHSSTVGYEVKGETMSVAASERHRFYYVKDMQPEEVMLLKCFDSWGEGMRNGRKGVAVRTPHTAFVDPDTSMKSKGRESIEVRCLVFYE
ncbi:hypothetical protein K432DRAFT_383406 [Lepidopterella palustris CBS 459.81]|uniref:7alpha-cephem-methoxylase P8 chain n=1 Tax=Lepidopterella palustris CBS 459.81 TaxID=1314670 RepID=A0A8E2JE07_9PEZI|nr:hypothetical protein K432DRAFT_383406 [Lepidopterella palustris CBS 459.81]